MRILYAGTPDIAVPSLHALYNADGIDVVGVLTAPDKVSGRGRKLSAPPVKKAALELSIPVIQPARLGSEAREMVETLGAELLVVFAYGRIFGPKFLALFSEGGINMHPSALPRHRGPAPISAAIQAGETETALTVQRVALEMDAGDILRQTSYPLNGSETTGSLTDAVARDAAPELVAVVLSLAGAGLSGHPQDHARATWCRLVHKDDGIINWSGSAEEIQRQVRACIPWPKARTSMDGEDLVILEAAVSDKDPGDDNAGSEVVVGSILGVDKSRGILVQTGKGVLVITRLQLASRKPLDYKAFLNGISMNAGTILGDVHES